MKLTRRQLLAGAGAGALTAAGAYELVDRLARAPARPAAAALPQEQHLLNGVSVVVDNGVEVLVPPLHHQVVTARLSVEPTRTAAREAQAAFEEQLGALERRFESTPAGLRVTV